MTQEEKYFKLLLNCEVSDIDFEEEVRDPQFEKFIPKNQQFQTLHVIVDGVMIPTNIVDFYILIKETIDGEYIYQPNIEVNPLLRRQGIAFKVYQAFIRLFGHATSYYINRKENAYNALDKNSKSTPINNLWNKLALQKDIHVNDIYDNNGKVIGQKAYSTDYLMNMDKN